MSNNHNNQSDFSEIVDCPNCDGIGSEFGDVDICQVCGGSGEIEL